MGQLSFFSAEATPPCVEDLVGLLCGPGQVVSFGRTAARLSVVVDEPWRADAIAAACAERDIEAECATSDEGHPLVRTAFRADLIELASSWTRGAVKAVPAGLTLGGAALRLWVLAAGRPGDGGYLLGLDPPRARHLRAARRGAGPVWAGGDVARGARWRTGIADLRPSPAGPAGRNGWTTAVCGRRRTLAGGRAGTGDRLGGTQ